MSEYTDTEILAGIEAAVDAGEMIVFLPELSWDEWAGLTWEQAREEEQETISNHRR